MSPAPVVLAPRLEVPASLLACQDQPEPPNPLRDDSALATYIVDLAAAGQDCRDHLGRMGGLVAAQPTSH